MKQRYSFYTCNVLGDYRNKTLWKTYYANEVTAIEVYAMNKKEARKIIKQSLGVNPVYIYE